MELVEGMEEFFLHPLFVAEKLDIVNEQHVRVPVFVVEPCGIAVIDAGNQVVAEFFAGNINNLVFRVILVHLMGNGMHQMGFSKTNASVDKKGIVDLSGRFRNCKGCCMS